MSKKELIRIYDDEGKLIKKQCGKCGEIKDIEEFPKHKSHKDGYNSSCKKCCNKKSNKYYQTNKDKILEDRKEYYEDNKEEILEYKKIYREENKEKLVKWRKEHYQENREEILKKRKEYREKNKEIISEKQRIYIEENKERLLECYRKYNKKHRDLKAKESISQVYDNFTKDNYPDYGIQYGVIYGIKCEKSDRWYIGQTIHSFDYRYKGNFFNNKIDEMNEDKRKLLMEDLEKYGEESFVVYKILDVAFSPMELDEKEVYYIDYYKAYENGYNSNRGYINGRQILYDTWNNENKIN